MLVEKTIDCFVSCSLYIYIYMMHTVFPLSVRSHVGDFHEDCLCASAQPTCIDPTKFPVNGNPPPHRLRAHPRTHRVFIESLSLLYKVGRSVLIIRQEDPDRVNFFTYSCSFSLKAKSRSLEAPLRGSTNTAVRKGKKRKGLHTSL